MSLSETEAKASRSSRFASWPSAVIATIVMLVLLSAIPVRAVIQPYTTDVFTLHLWHLDGVSTPATNGIAANTNLSVLANGGSLGIASYAGFGNCLSTVDGGQAGITATDKDACLSVLTLANGTGDDVNLTLADAVTGAFTMEAMVRIDFDPAANLSARATPMQIFSGEGDGSADRIFQFRLDPVGFVGGGGDTNVARIEFINLRQASGTQNIVFNIPTNGTHAISQSQWFHVAVTYSGDANVTDNLRCYWTRVSVDPAAANLIGTATMVNDMSVAACDFVVGNEGRATSGSSDNFVGLIDEVRISSAARDTNEFIFRGALPIVSASSTEPATTNYPSNTLDGDLNSRWSAGGDGQWIQYDLGRHDLVQSVDIAFYQGNTRTATFDVLTSSDAINWRTALQSNVSSGATLALQNFNFTDWPARYVRIVGHGNSVNNFNSFTEVNINHTAAPDTDADGLPDAWEMFYFTNLTATLNGDPDSDLQSNSYEFLHGTNPTVANSNGDTDNDGLPDAWEIANFGNLGQSATGDPDRDGYSNLVENQNGSDPNNANSITGDTDGDNLPDAWEAASFGTTTNFAYDDFDSDGYNNLAEMVAGTSPTNSVSKPSWVSPRVSFVRDSIVTTNACLMPSGSAYGRAINGIAFQTKILHTFDGYQYTAWYDTTGSGTTTQTVWLARRTISGLNVGSWESYKTTNTLVNGKAGWDAHNVIALGISPLDGTLHFAWDHHTHPLRYRRSVMGLCTTNKAAWGSAGMFNIETSSLTSPATNITGVTYPRFYNTPSGGLVFEYRTGTTTAGDHYLHNYIPGTGFWSTRWKTDAKEGSYTGVLQNGTTGTSTSRNAYENGYDIGPDGTMHHTWTFREAADSANHDICYAYSTNGGVTWLNNAGTLVVNTATNGALRVDTPGTIVKVLDSRQRYINQQAQCVDNDGRFHTVGLHRRAEPAYAWVAGDSGNQFSTMDTAYFHYFRDPITRVWSQRMIPATVFPVGCRPDLGFDSTGNVYAVFLSYPPGTDIVPGYRNGTLVIASASKASQYTDWEIVQSLPVDLNGEPRIDQAHLLADNILSVFIQENSATTTVVGTKLHVYDFAVSVTRPDGATPVTLDFVGNDSLVNITSQTNYTYQLRKTTDLNPTVWTTNGSPISGNGWMLTLPDAGGHTNSQIFYNVIRTP